jgi:hypothetical protein
MTIIFKAQTSEGFMMKILGEIFHNILKNICLRLCSTGIFTRMMDSHKRVLLDAELYSENFTTYYCAQPMVVGINILHFHKIVSSIKKKDTVILQIDDESPTELQIIIMSKEKDNVDKSSLFIQNVQLFDIELPTGYNQPIHVAFAKFHKMCKNMSNISPVLHVYGSSSHVRFFCETHGIYKKDVVFGDATDQESIHYLFDTEQFARISKIAGLNSVLHFYIEKTLPLLIKANIGTLGRLKVYIKDKES